MLGVDSIMFFDHHLSEKRWLVVLLTTTSRASLFYHILCPDVQAMCDSFKMHEEASGVWYSLGFRKRNLGSVSHFRNASDFSLDNRMERKHIYAVR